MRIGTAEAKKAGIAKGHLKVAELGIDATAPLDSENEFERTLLPKR